MESRNRRSEPTGNIGQRFSRKECRLFPYMHVLKDSTVIAK